jgi:CHAT domain-containing protein/Tfp pilus assembly protein PilF
MSVTPGAAAALLLCAVPRLVTAGPEAGVVVTVVARGFEGENVGLRPGDVLLEWRQGEERGALASPFELKRVEAERAPLGSMQLTGLRSGTPLSVTLASGDWGVETRPQLSPELLAIYDGVVALPEGDPGADEYLQAEIRKVQRVPAIDVRVFLLLFIGTEYAYQNRLDRMRDVTEEALAAARAAGDRWLEAMAWTKRALGYLHVGNLADGLSAYREALAVHRARDPQGLAAAEVLAMISVLSVRLEGKTPAGRASAEEAVALGERIAPRSSMLAAALEALAHHQTTREDTAAATERALAIREALGQNNRHVAKDLRWLAMLQGDTQQDFEKAAAYARRSLAFLETLTPESLEIAEMLTVVTEASLGAGDLDAAKRTAERAVLMRDRLKADDTVVADGLVRLATVLVARGDLAEAEAAYLRILQLYEARAPDGRIVAGMLGNLGYVARLQEDFQRAQAYLERALAITEKGGWDAETATVLANLAEISRERGDLATAEARYRRVIAIRTAVDPTTPLLSVTEERLGRLLMDRGTLGEAETLFRRALARDSPAYSYPRHQALGDLALRRGDLDAAESHYRQALELRRVMVPGTLDEAEASRSLAAVARRQGRTDEAVALLYDAGRALEAYASRVGGSPEVRARFRAGRASVYRELEELLLELGRREEAFQVTERARARALIADLAQRRLTPAQGVPEDVERERRSADAEYDRLFREASSPGTRRAALAGELEAARRRQDHVRARLRSVAPRSASIRDPEPLDLAGVRGVLDPGTLLLAHRLGPERSRVYAVGPGADDFGVFGVDAGEQTIRDQVRSFRERIEVRRGSLLQAALFDEARRLSRLLLAPVADRLARAERLLIVPDGVLNLLPFAALADPGSAEQRFLVEAKPLHLISSVTLYALISRPRERPPGESPSVAGFGDPAYPAARSESPPLASALRSGLRLDPLPATRGEVEALRELSPGARLWVGAEATEARAKSIGEDARIVHFACHGFVDEKFPLESGLALSIPGEWKPGDENGLLQAWEVLQSMRIDADLVTLSACRTGVGKELAGEGLLGLTWAFQYAGAKSVVASLWEVGDASTAALMRRFYRELRDGAPKAEALRRAQVELLRRPSTAAPYFWAAFQLTGDWR